MKKLIILASALLLLLACQKAENILQIVPGAPDDVGAGNLPRVTSISPGVGQELVDQNSSQSGIQGEIVVGFSDFMDPNTMNESNITILNTETGTAISGDLITTEYYPEIKKLYIFIDDVPTASPFLLTLSNMTNTYGLPLDFDLDNNEDGVPYDDYLTSFWTVNNLDTVVRPIYPHIADFTPDTVATWDSLQRVRIVFNGGSSMDTLTLNTSNVILENSSGNAQSLTIIQRTANWIIVEPTSPLAIGDNYTITVKCANIKRTGDSRTPVYLLSVDGDDDGPEATEPDIQSYFRVDTVIPPFIVDVADIANGAVFIFNRLIDETTISNNSIIVFDDLGYIPGDFHIYTDIGNNYTIVEYYYKRTTSGNPDAFVSRSIKDASKDYYLDGDGNGIGGEAWDDYWEQDF